MKHITIIGLVAALLVGCDAKPHWELVTTKDGLVYRINKDTGEVSLVALAQITKLDEFRGPKTDPTKKSYLRDWPAQSVKSLGDISLRLKTTWRDGRLHYILTVSPISSQLQKARATSYSDAVFNLGFYDADGFQLFTLPVKVSEMIQVVDDAGKPQSFRATGEMQCSADDYEVIAAPSVGWAGFPPAESP